MSATREVNLTSLSHLYDSAQSVTTDKNGSWHFVVGQTFCSVHIESTRSHITLLLTNQNSQLFPIV